MVYRGESVTILCISRNDTTIWLPREPINQRSENVLKRTDSALERPQRLAVPWCVSAAGRVERASPPQNLVFPRKSRLSRATFPHGGRAPRLSSPHFTVLVPPTGHGYAVVIPKKTLRRAVDRHRLKRRVIEALQCPGTVALPPTLILFPTAATLNLPVQDLRAELSLLLSKLSF